jgi:1-phosphofructokinase family hexose kinase
VLIAAPNLTLDRMLRIDELRPGEVLRFSDATIAPGGKGVNVARVCRTLGFPAQLVAMAPGRTGLAVVELLRDEGVEMDIVAAPGEVRVASIVLERSGRVTVLNEPGPAVSERDWRAFEDAVDRHVADHRYLVCIGSTPPGSPPDAYGRLVGLARERGSATLVDASGSSLANALRAGPDLVTPNLAEAEDMLLGGTPQPAAERSPEAADRAIEAAVALVERGAAAAVVTVGAGVAAVRGQERWWVDAPQVKERNPIGAGDSLVGGLVGSLERGHGLQDALHLGVAAASASVETDLPGLVDPARVSSLTRLLSSEGD